MGAEAERDSVRVAAATKLPRANAEKAEFLFQFFSMSAFIAGAAEGKRFYHRRSR